MRPGARCCPASSIRIPISATSSHTTSEAETETRAAILGGVTTIGIFLRSLEDSYFDHLPAFRKAMDERSYVDSVFHPQIFTEQQIEEIPRLRRAVRHPLVQVLHVRHARHREVGDRRRAAGRLPQGGVARAGRGRLRALRDRRADRPRRATTGRTQAEGTLADWEDAHPAVAEALAIQTAVYLAKLAGAHLYVVHLSSHQGLEVVRAARRAGARFTVETTTPYLGINSHDPNGFLVKMVPPVRTPEHQVALWEGLLEGSINTVGTDNTSRARATKRPEAGLHGARPGLPALGTHLPALLHYGRLRGVPLEVLVERATRAPGAGLRHLSAEGHDRGRLRCRPGGGRPRARARRARRGAAGHVGLLAVRRQVAARLAGRHHQGRQDHRARRQDRRARPTAATCRASPRPGSSSSGSAARRVGKIACRDGAMKQGLTRFLPTA